MQRILIAGALGLAAISQAFAADLPVAPPLAPPPPIVYVPPVYNWNGVYIGLNGGGAFGNSSWTDQNNPNNPAGTGSFGTSGFLGGGTIGGNFQIGWGVWGLEADLDYTTIKGSITPTAPNFCALNVTAAIVGTTCNTQNNWLGTLRGRVGVAFDRVLFFATGGLAAGNVRAGLDVGAPSYQSSTEFGWTVGAGVEVAFTHNWTGKLEYLYVDLGQGVCSITSTCGFNDAALTVPANIAVNFTTSVVRLGVNYKFGD